MPNWDEVFKKKEIEDPKISKRKGKTAYDGDKMFESIEKKYKELED